MGSTALAADSVVEPEMAYWRIYPQADSRAQESIKRLGLGHLINEELWIAAPGAAVVEEDNSRDRLRDRLAKFSARQKHIVAPESVFAVSSKTFRSTNEELFEERQFASGGSCS